jgi:hypothetical protein
MKVFQIVSVLEELKFALTNGLDYEVTGKVIHLSNLVLTDKYPESVHTLLDIFQELTKEKNDRLLLSAIPLFQYVVLQLVRKEFWFDGFSENFIYVKGKCLEIFCCRYRLQEENLVRLFFQNASDGEIMATLGLPEDDKDFLKKVRAETVNLLLTKGYETLNVRLHNLISEKESNYEKLEYIVHFAEKYQIRGNAEILSKLIKRELKKEPTFRSTSELVDIFHGVNLSLLNKKRWLQMVRVFENFEFRLPFCSCQNKS